MKHLYAVLLNLLLGLLLGLTGPSQADEPASTPADHARIQTTLGRLPLYFVENWGQVGGPIDYYLLGGQTQVGLGAEGVTFVQIVRPASDMKPESGLRRVSLEAERPAVRRHALQLRFVEAATVRPQGRMPSEARVNYFKGSKEQWKTGVPTYEEVVYSELWPGVDLVYRGTGGQMKSTFHVQPGANPTRIQLAYAGATGVTVTDAGTLRVETPITAFEEAAPVVYQEIGGEQRMVDARYQVTQGAAGEWRYWFALGEYDAAYPLVIDPVVLSYAGFIGGSGVDYGFGIAVDGTGATYVTGSTTSTEADFPVLGGPDLTYNGNQDAFVAKIKPDGSGLVYAGFIGGGGTERWSRGIAVDGSGAAYVTGWTTSTESTGFPVLVGPDLTFNGGLDDAFVAKIKPDGSGLEYAGYIGGSVGGAGQDFGTAIAVDGSGAAYVTGLTQSTEADFPVLVGPDLTFNGGSGDAFVAKVKPDGSGLDYAGYIGGSGSDIGYAIAVDGSGAAYVMGLTDSTEADFPVTVGPDLTANGGIDAFVAKVAADGTGLVYAGFIGGSGDDEGWGIAVDGAGAAYGTGRTSSTESTGFPVLGGPDLTANSGQDGFVAKVKLDGSGLVYAGFIGGGGTDWSNGIAVDSSGAAYVVGNTDSTEVDFPVLVGPDLTFNGGGGDAFVAKVKPDGSGLGYAGYIGGSGNEYGLFIAVDGSGAAYVTGSTDSTETSFPVTVGPDLTANGGSDVFVAKILSSFVVTNLNDSGAGSLRQAVLDANAAPGADTITFQAGLTGTIALTSGQIDIAGDLILQGPGARILTVSGNNASRILTVAVGTTVTIDGLTLANGSSGSGNNGGAIDNQGALTVANSTLSGNRASYGGGIHNSSTGALTVTNSTLSGNVGTVFGGGIYNPGATGALTVTNSTLSGNRATYYGGGIYNVGTLTVTHSTLFDNRTGSTVNNSRGGGIYTLGDLIIGNSLVSANFSLVGKEIYNGQAIRFTSQGHNLFGVNGDAGLTNATPVPSDLIPGAGVLIGQLICGLANNGGPTQTHLLATGSPAIDAGDNALIPPGVTTDQRGPGFPRIVNTTVDIGAVEGSGACTIAIHTVTATAGAGGTISPPSAPVNDGATTTFTVTPDPNYAIQAVAGCGGTLAGNTYTTGPITADCTVGASFSTTAVYPQVSAGGYHTCGLKSDGTLACWGYPDIRITPLPPGAFTQVDSGASGSCALKSDGTLACWGVNDVGQATPPAGVFTQLSTGWDHSCALKSDGTLVCWGYNNYGQVTPLAGTFTQVSAGGYHTCGVKSDNTVACWGWNNDGQANPPAGTFTQVSAGWAHTCGVKSDGTLTCWGLNTNGQASPPAGTFTQVSAGGGNFSGGDGHTCGVKSDNTLACWGNNAYGQASPPAGTFTQVSAGRTHTCGVQSDGIVACWGDNTNGQSRPILTVTLAGTGTGTVSSAPAGVDCGPTCISYPPPIPVPACGPTCRSMYPPPIPVPATVVLTAAPAAGSTFTGWSGACTADPCTVTMDQARNVTATFTINNTHTVTPVAGAGGTINPNTPQTVNDGATTTFTVTPDPNYAIQAVAGCGGTLAGSTYTTGPITADCTVGASFRATVNTLTVTLAGAGSGTVTSVPAGITCGADCTETYPVGAVVTLTAAPDASSTFLGWSGACIGTGSCTVTMDAVRKVTALFGVTTAATLTVNTLRGDDTDDGCDTADCSLREAVAAAASGDTIDFAPGLNGGTITLSSFISLDLNKSLTIQGSGASQLAISGGDAQQLFQTGWNGSVVVILDGLTLRNGRTTGQGGAIYHGDSHLLIRNSILMDNTGDGGGAIWNYGKLTISNSTLMRNTTASPSGGGGAIANYNTLTVTGSTFDHNNAGTAGAILNHGTATVDDSVVTSSQATIGNGGAFYNYDGCTLIVRNSLMSGNTAGDGGGAISNYPSSNSLLTVAHTTLSNNTANYGGGIASFGTTTVSYSTLSGNQALVQHGGGIVNSIGTLTVINSTLSGNAAVGYGGGIFSESGGSTTVSDSTITGNTATFGGGINSQNPLTLGNNLVAGNTATNSVGEGKEIWVEVANWNSQGHNLIGKSGDAGMGGGATLAATDFTPLTPIAAIIGPLAANGGPTQTHLPVAGGPAIDTGDDALIPAGITTDQRGVARIQGLHVDVGAVEGSSILPCTVTTIVRADPDPTAAASVRWTVTLTEPVTGLTTSNFALVPGGGVSGAAITSVTGTGAGLTWTVTADTGTGSGTLGLNMANATGVTPTVANLPFTGEVYTVAKTLSHTVTAQAGAGGTISPASQTVNDGATATFTVTPAPNYAILAVGSSGCGGTLTGNSYTTDAIIADCGVYASFIATAYPLMVMPAGAGSGAVTGPGINCGASCTGTYAPGTVVTLTAAPAGGSTFTGWSGACGGTGACTVTMNAAQTVVALFGVTTAATLTVNKVADTNDGSCDVADCSLREAVAAANPLGGDTIDFAPSLNGGPPIVLGSVITLAKSLTIQGPGASLLAISGGGAQQIFDINSGVTVTLDGLTLQDGYAPNGGGAIHSQGTLTVSRSTLVGNRAEDLSHGSYANGGAIYNEGGMLTVTDSTLSGNTSPFGSAGAIGNTGTATLRNSTVSDNTAWGGGGGIWNWNTMDITGSTLSSNTASEGGGIENTGTLTVTDSTLLGNSSGCGGGIGTGNSLTVINSALINNTALSSGCGGGGIQTFPGGTVIVTNSTLSGNTAVLSGGGINGHIALSVTNCTLTGNSANYGGGINGQLITIGNSLVAGNIAPNGKEVHTGGSFFTSHHNLFGENGDPGIEGATPAGTDLVLAGAINTAIAPLANNGGPTQTHLPVAGGPVIDAGDNALIPAGVTTDQRGVARIQNGTVDIGAVEGSSTTPTLSINNVSQIEGNSGNTPFIFTVTLSAAASLPVTVDWATADGTATAGSDYTAASGSLTFPVGGPLTQTLTVPVIGDTTAEPNETFFVNLSNPVNATLAQAQGTGTIINDDSPTLSINNVSQNEGNSGNTPFTFTVTLSAAASLPVTVDWATADGTATAGSDYTAASGSLTFPVGGPLTQTLTVQATGDTLTEPNETFVVNLSAPVNATLAQAQGTGTIVNDDSPTLSINNVSQNEGNSGNTPFIFTVTLSAAASLPVTVNWATADNTATAGSDYTAASGSLTFPVGGPLTQTLTVPVIGDTTAEPNETFVVNLSAPVNATLAQAQGTGTIVNDDSPTLSINNVSQNEGNSGTTPFNFTVTLSAAASLPVTVNWATADGTATAGSDYTAASGTLTFPVGGPLTQTLTVQATGDTLTEPNETFFVNLSAPVNATLAQAQGTGTIINDDAATGLLSIAWSGDQFVAVGTGGAILTSPDGATWTAITPAPTTQDLYGVAWSGQRFVVVGKSGTILTSPDGATWTAITPSPTTQPLYGITWAGGQFAAVGEGGAILTSADGLNWIVRVTGTP
ncbi:MAG: Calx-beta domain-containing protein [Candidatus Contendobacter sp.]